MTALPRVWRPRGGRPDKTWAASVCVLGSLFSLEARAQPDSALLAASVSPAIVEVVSGGSWIEGPASGIYRTVSIQVGGSQDRIEIYLQWVGARTPTGQTELIASLPLREFNEHHYASASVAIESQGDGKAGITITVPEGDAVAIKPMGFTAMQPGQYRLLAPNALSGVRVPR